MKIKVDEKLISHLENLAKLELTAEERKKLAEELEKILDYMSTLDEVNVDDIEEMVSPIENSMTPREDRAQKFEHVDSLIELFPKKDGRYLKVPKIY